MLLKGRNVTKRNVQCYKKDKMLLKGTLHVTKSKMLCYQKYFMLQKGVLESFL